MTRVQNWEPGDVAMIRVGTGDWEFGVRRDDGTWGCQHTRNGFGDHDVTAQRVVVIDPEDREQVERLQLTQWRQHGNEDAMREGLPWIADKLQAALREFANPTPPKPERPTGRFAEVEDADGNNWFQLYSDSNGDNSWARDGEFTAADEWVSYASIDVVRVLSSGVPA